MALAHYKGQPYISGGEEISQGDNTLCVPIEIAPGTTSIAIPLWVCCPENSHYYGSVVVDPVDISGSDQSTWVQLAADNAGVPGAWQAPSASLAVGTIGPGPNLFKRHFLKVTVPGTATAAIKLDVKLQVNYNRVSVIT